MKYPTTILCLGAVFAMLALTGCKSTDSSCCQPAPATTTTASTVTPVSSIVPGPPANSTNKTARRYTYTPRPYPVDEHGFSPVDKALAKAYAREDMVADDGEGALNPYIL